MISLFSLVVLCTASSKNLGDRRSLNALMRGYRNAWSPRNSAWSLNQDDLYGAEYLYDDDIYNDGYGHYDDWYDNEYYDDFAGESYGGYAEAWEVPEWLRDGLGRWFGRPPSQPTNQNPPSGAADNTAVAKNGRVTHAQAKRAEAQDAAKRKKMEAAQRKEEEALKEEREGEEEGEGDEESERQIRLQAILDAAQAKSAAETQAQIQQSEYQKRHGHKPPPPPIALATHSSTGFKTGGKTEAVVDLEKLNDRLVLGGPPVSVSYLSSQVTGPDRRRNAQSGNWINYFFLIGGNPFDMAWTVHVHGLKIPISGKMKILNTGTIYSGNHAVETWRHQSVANLHPHTVMTDEILKFLFASTPLRITSFEAVN